MTADALAEGRVALARHDWDGAYAVASSFDATGDETLEAERLDLLADSAWWLGRLDECIAAREAAYRAFDDSENHRRAGQCAVWLYEHHLMKAQPSIAGAWLRRARRAVGSDPDCTTHGALLLREAEAAHGSGFLADATTLAYEALALGRRLRSADLEAEALQTLGRIMIDEGQPADGLSHLDEAMLFAIEGRLGPYSTGKVYCSLISACEALGDQRRASEWTDATARWAQQHPFAIFPGICRVHRATALGWSGALRDAETEAMRACDELASIHVPNAAAAYAEVGDIRRRLGDLAGAEEAFAVATNLSGQPSAAVALLRLAQGQVAAATIIITTALDGNGWDRLGRARLLPAHVQIAIAAGDLALARSAATELHDIAVAFTSPWLLASAETARGRVALATGETSATRTIRAALTRWQELNVPYEVATARTLLGQALRLQGDEAGATQSFAAARTMFDNIGAQLNVGDLDHADPSTRLPAGLTEREVEVLRLVASGQTNKEVAASLFLSDKTVSRHLSNIFTKINVATRSGATAFAFAHDLVR